MEGLIEEATRGGFTLRMTPSGIVPAADEGRQADAGGGLSRFAGGGKKRLEETRGEIEKSRR